MDNFLNFQTRFYSFIYIFVFVLLLGTYACQGINFAAEREIAKVENHNTNQPQENANSSAANSSRETFNSSQTVSIADIAGEYEASDYRAGKGGNVNSLTITESGASKINVAWEGTNLNMANGAETFHARSASGDLQLKGNTASGKLTEEGGESTCAVTLTFSAGGKFTLKSSACDLGVLPDGVYEKAVKKKNETEKSDSSAPDETERAAKKDSSSKPFMQYDDAGAPVAVMNLMTGEQRGDCDPKELTFTGKVMKVDFYENFVSEFTLAGSNRKRQNFSIIVGDEDGVSPDELSDIISDGTNLTVKYINCGNAPIAAPVTIYKN